MSRGRGQSHQAEVRQKAGGGRCQGKRRPARRGGDRLCRRWRASEVRPGSGAPGLGTRVTLAPAGSGRRSSRPCARGWGVASTACAEPLSAPPGNRAAAAPAPLRADSRAGLLVRLPAQGPGFPAPGVQPLLADETCPGAFGVQSRGVQAWPSGDQADHSPPNEPASQAGDGVEMAGTAWPGGRWSLTHPLATLVSAPLLPAAGPDLLGTGLVLELSAPSCACPGLMGAAAPAPPAGWMPSERWQVRRDGVLASGLACCLGCLRRGHWHLLRQPRWL